MPKTGLEPKLLRLPNIKSSYGVIYDNRTTTQDEAEEEEEEEGRRKKQEEE